MHKLLQFLSASMLVLCVFSFDVRGQKARHFKMVAVAELGEIHQPYVDAAKIWLNQFAVQNNFSIDYVESPESFTDEFLAKYQLIFQLNYPPYRWSDVAKSAFEKYVNEGRGGWIGVHHASLVGEFDGYPMWPWFSDFLGGIRWKNYIAGFASAEVVVEDKKHPCLKNVPSKFLVVKDEWYTWDFSPRANVKILAHVDEASYSPGSNIKMGDHPVIWTNEHVAARNIYIFMGHDPSLFQNAAYISLLSSSIFWASGRN